MKLPKHATDFYGMVPKGPVSNLLFRQEICRRAMVEPEFAGMMRTACRADPFFYFNTFTWTYNPARPHPRKHVPFVTYGYQDKALDVIFDSLEDLFDISVEKSRQMGASVLFSYVIQYCWRFRQGQNFMMLSRSDEYVDRTDEPKALFYKINYIHRYLPRWLMPSGWNPRLHRKVKRIVNPENGNTVVGEATTENSASGGTYTAVLHDEFSKCDVGMGILKSTRAATGTRWFNATPQGTGNAHYRIVQHSHQNPRQIRPLRFHWTDHPEYAKLLYKLDDDGNPIPSRKTKKADLGAYLEEHADDVAALKKKGFWEGYRVRSPWFDKQCLRCTTEAEIAQEMEIDYGGAGYQFFSQKAINDLIREHCIPPAHVGTLDYDRQSLEPFGFLKEPRGRLEMWCALVGKTPRPPCRPYVMGVDASAGSGASNSVLSIWNAQTGEKAAQYVDPTEEGNPENLAKIAIALCRWFWDAYMIWEMGGTGSSFGAYILEWGYGRYYKRNPKTEIGETGTTPGWAPTRDNTFQLLGKYRRALSEGTVCNFSETAMLETLQYNYVASNWVQHSAIAGNEDPSGAKSAHGDRVIADALAVKVMEDQPKQVTEVKRVHSQLSVAGRRQARKEREKVESNPYVFN
jgi:hypothetical protein